MGDIRPFGDVVSLGPLLDCLLISNHWEIVRLDLVVRLGSFLETFVTLGLLLKMFVS